MELGVLCYNHLDDVAQGKSSKSLYLGVAVCDIKPKVKLVDWLTRGNKDPHCHWEMQGWVDSMPRREQLLESNVNLLSEHEYSITVKCSWCICVYVCMCVCTHLCMHACVHACVCKCKCICARTHMRTRACVCVCCFLFVFVFVLLSAIEHVKHGKVL